MPSFLGEKSRGAFGQPAFFLAGNRRPSTASLAKRLYESTEVLHKKTHLISINGKKRFKRILVKVEKFKLQKLPSKDFIALFSSQRRACPVLKHNRVSEVEGSKATLGEILESVGTQRFGRLFVVNFSFNKC